MRRFSALALPLTLVALSLLGLGLPGCDTVTNPFPPAETQTAGRRDSLALDSVEAARPAPVFGQRVLLENFTGHTCGNCPRAAQVVGRLLAQYSDRLVVVAPHIGSFAAPRSDTLYFNDYRTPAGEELNTRYGIDNFGLPQGMVNRAPAAGGASPVVSEGAWAERVATELALVPEQDLRVTARYAPATRTLGLKIRTQYRAAQPGRTFRLVVNILEDSIRSYQKDYARAAGNIRDYTHRHLLRAAPLGTFGAVQTTAPGAGQQVLTYLTLPVPTNWNPRHLVAVAYLLDDQTRRVTQVAETAP